MKNTIIICCCLVLFSASIVHAFECHQVVISICTTDNGTDFLNIGTFEQDCGGLRQLDNQTSLNFCSGFLQGDI